MKNRSSSKPVPIFNMNICHTAFDMDFFILMQLIHIAEVIIIVIIIIIIITGISLMTGCGRSLTERPVTWTLYRSYPVWTPDEWVVCLGASGPSSIHSFLVKQAGKFVTYVWSFISAEVVYPPHRQSRVTPLLVELVVIEPNIPHCIRWALTQIEGPSILWQLYLK